MIHSIIRSKLTQAALVTASLGALMMSPIRSWATEEELQRAIDAQPKIMDKVYELSKKHQDQAKTLRILEQSASIASAILLRSNMIKYSNELTDANEERIIKEFKAMPKIRKMLEDADAARKANPNAVPSGGKVPLGKNASPTPSGKPSLSADTPSPSKPDIVLDGKDVPKELEFKKQGKDARPLRDQVLEAVRRRLGLEAKAPAPIPAPHAASDTGVSTLNIGPVKAGPVIETMEFGNTAKSAPAPKTGAK